MKACRASAYSAARWAREPLKLRTTARHVAAVPRRATSEAMRRIARLFEEQGAGAYDIGEPVSIAEHSVQAAAAAQSRGAPDHVVAAALLHDVGHMLQLEAGLPPGMNGFGAQRHEHIGAEFVRQLGFAEEVAWLVAQHVNAKRYLVAVDPHYYARLSGASKSTLLFQGGPMSKDEAAAAAGDSRWPMVLAMREFDEAAKDPEFARRNPTQTLQSFHDLLEAQLSPRATSKYVLSSEQKRKWHEDGVLHLRGALPPLLSSHKALSAMADELASLDGRPGPWLVHKELPSGSNRAQLCRIENFCRHVSTWQACCGFISDLAGALCGEPVTLFKDKINFKGPGGAGFRWPLSHACARSATRSPRRTFASPFCFLLPLRVLCRHTVPRVLLLPHPMSWRRESRTRSPVLTLVLC